MPDLLGGDDSTPQFKDVFREFLAMKDFQSKESKFHFWTKDLENKTNPSEKVLL